MGMNNHDKDWKNINTLFKRCFRCLRCQIEAGSRTRTTKY